MLGIIGGKQAEMDTGVNHLTIEFGQVPERCCMNLCTCVFMYACLYGEKLYL